MTSSCLTPQVKRIVRRDRALIEVEGQEFLATVWVGLGPLDPDRDDLDDHTLPEVTRRYLTKRALTRAIESGDAFL